MMSDISEPEKITKSKLQQDDLMKIIETLEDRISILEESNRSLRRNLDDFFDVYSDRLKAIERNIKNINEQLKWRDE